MSKLSNKKLCLLYLEKYAEKDLEAVAEMFAETIILRDWKIRVEGKQLAIAETQKNFTAAASITIEVLATYENEHTVAAELLITVNNTERLHVVDVITFDMKGKIVSIRAYLGRGDEQ
nr:nuclear transport factor 2 family protein [Allomuricauda sp.]